MNTLLHKNIAVVGGGAISKEYCDILTAFKIEFTVITRSKELVGFNSIKADVLRLDSTALAKFDGFIVCVQAEFNFAVLNHLLQNTFAPIFIEKPLSLGYSDHIHVESFFDRIYLGLNRRKFPSVMKLRELVRDKSPLKVLVEITEIPARKLGSPKALAAWPLMNTIHVIDLALHISDAYAFGETDLLGKYSDSLVRYTLTDTTNSIEIAFVDFQDLVGNWGIEVSSVDEKLILRPLEKLYLQQQGHFARIEEQLVRDEFKPGFRHNLEGFLACDRGAFITYDEYCFLIRTISEIFQVNSPN